MKILVFHQPFPMGNYKLNATVAHRLSSLGHEVYLVEQLNGRPATPEYIQYISNENFDVVYYEMLDAETFKVVEQLKCLRILLVASRGIFKDFTDILNYKGTYYDRVLTNSLQLKSLFENAKVPTEYFEFYFSAINEAECIKADKYQFDNVFLGMGFARQNDPDYGLEQNTFFNSSKSFQFGLFGNGWSNQKDYQGLLPPGDIGSLYTSAKSAAAIIGAGQRSMGMINNRYTEIAFCKCPIISLPYDIDWKGADRYINFVSSVDEYNKVVNDIITNPDEYLEKSKEFHKFIVNQDQIFFDKLLNLIQ